MSNNKFNKFFVGSLKRTAQNVYPLVRRKAKLQSTITEAQAELETLQAQIEAYQIPIKQATGGYGTEELVDRVVTDTGKVDKDGNPIKVTTYVLKYPDTIIPPTEETQEVQEETPVVEETPVENNDPFNF